MSNTIMESMAAGKPMVATRVGGNAELIAEGETGFLVPPRDPAALADAIERILEDPALAKAMGLQARVRIAQRFSVEAMVKSTERLYDEALGARESGRAARGAGGGRSRRPHRPRRVPVPAQRGRLLPARDRRPRRPWLAVPDLLASRLRRQGGPRRGPSRS